MTAESTSLSTILVSSCWLEQNLDNPRLRIISTDSSRQRYDAGHIPGAIFWEPLPAALFCDELGLYLEPHHIEPLLGIRGIDEDSCVVFTADRTPKAVGWCG